MAIIVLLCLAVPSASLLTGFPVTPSSSFSQVFSTSGDVRIAPQSLSLLIGPEKAAIFESSSGLISDLELELQSQIEYGTTLILDISDAHSEQTLFLVTVSPPNIVVTCYGRNQVYNETCEYGYKEEIRRVYVEFGVPYATVAYEGIQGRKSCAEVLFSAFGKEVRYSLTAGSARPRTVVVGKIGWEAAKDPWEAVKRLQERTEKFVKEMGKALERPANLSSIDAVLEQLKKLEDEIEAMEQRVVSLAMRWEALKPTEYMVRPEHLIHHFRIVLRDFEREVGHLYDRITHGALSAYAERFIHERKEVMPMEVLLGAYAWQVEKKLGDLKEHISTMERFTWILAISAGLVLAGVVSAAVVKKAEKLHKL